MPIRYVCDSYQINDATRELPISPPASSLAGSKEELGLLDTFFHQRPWGVLGALRPNPEPGGVVLVASIAHRLPKGGEQE